MEQYDEELGEMAAIEKDIQLLTLADICKVLFHLCKYYYFLF